MAIGTLTRTLAALAFGLAGPALAQDITITTAQGEVSLPAAPQKIVVLDVAAADTLDALGVPIAGAPAKLYVEYLKDVQDSALPVGSLFEPDFEAIAGLAPDLIIAGGRSVKQVEPLSRIAPAVDMSIWGGDHIATALARLRSYGALMGREAAAAELEAEFNATLARAKAAVAGRGAALIVMTNGPKISAYGAGSRFGWLHKALALPEAVESVDAQTHGEAVSFEFIAEADPEWLIVVDRATAIGQDNQSAAVTLDNALVAGTRAWRKGQVIYLDAAGIYVAGGGIQSMTGTLEEILEGFGTGG
jgi:iron complex transport system substrate-binding protein